MVIETFKPGYLDGLDIGYRQLSENNPGLIFCAISSYGHYGADAEKHANQPGYDILDQARGVIMSITGEPDLDPEIRPRRISGLLKHGNWMGWYAGGAWSALGILMAMFYRPQRPAKGKSSTVPLRKGCSPSPITPCNISTCPGSRCPGPGITTMPSFLTLT